MKKYLLFILFAVISFMAFSQITITSTVTNVSCFGGSNGSATISATGGSGAPYTYTLTSPLQSNSTGIFTGLTTGTYTFIAKDVASNTNTVALTITEPSWLTSISSVTNVACFGTATGAAVISPSGGTPPYSYSWQTGQMTQVVSNLPTGVISYTVTDINGCTSVSSVTILQPSQLSANISFTNVSCFGICNGGISAFPLGGIAPYTYTWSVGSTSPNLQNICTGLYNLGITDAMGCSVTHSVMISQPSQLVLMSNTTNASCNGTCNGSATVSVFGGTPAYSFTSQPTGITAGINTNLCSGIYTVSVQDANACWLSTVLYISPNGGTSLPNATVTTTPYNETCYLSSDGAIDLSITGTNPGPFTYLWSNGATTQDITNMPSDVYWVNIIDGSSNCMTIGDTINSIGTNCGTIIGNVYIDNNSDCIKNSGDNNYQNSTIIVNPGNRLGIANSNGDYVINNLPYGSYSVSINNTLANVYPSCTTTIISSVNGGSPNSINNNLSVAFNSAVLPDLQVYAYSNGIVPGFVCHVNYQLNNLNNISATGLFKAILPSAFIPNISTGNPNTYTISGDTIIWNFNNITNATGSNFFTINFTVPLSTPLGSVFTTCMWAQPTVTDLNYVNNTTCYQRLVTGSFDPNDKTVSPVGVGANGDIAATETDLTYLIRFQNTGNGPAVNIFVKDTLSPNVDINTFEMLGSSHNYMIDVLPGNVLRWKFNNIMLPDSNSNEPASHGYIQYRIKRTNNNTPGTQIKNTAYIYFDFNEPVVTNTAINTIETITGIKSSLNTNDEWNVYPNPSTGALYIVNSSSVKEESQIQVINSIGQTVLEETITSNYKNVDLSKLNNGVYFVKIVSDKQSVIKRVVLSR